MFNSHNRRIFINMAKQPDVILDKDFDSYITLKNIAAYLKKVENQQQIIKDAIKILNGEDKVKSMRASWLLLHVSNQFPKLIAPNLKHLIIFLKKENTHTGAIRNVIKILHEIQLPEKFTSEVFDICLKHIKNTTLPHAVRVYAIYEAAIICETYPELKPEVELLLNELKSFPQAPSITVAINKTLKNLLKM